VLLDSALGVGVRRQVIAEREPVSPYLWELVEKLFPSMLQATNE
jgi:hypothetical protein